MKIRILIPTYNEAANVKKLVNKINFIARKPQNFNLTLTIIDDNSPDGTARVVKELIYSKQIKNINLEILSRQKKDGLGKAYLYGFKDTLALEYWDYIIQMDADLSHNPSYIPIMISEAEKGSDFIVASRYISGGAIPDWSFTRKILSKFGNLYSRLLLGNIITDYTGGFNMFSIGLLKSFDIDKLDVDGYGFLINLKYNLCKKAKRIVEVPIVFHDRKFGNSKMPMNTILKNFLLVLKLKR